MHDDKRDPFVEEFAGRGRGGSRTAPTNDQRDQFVGDLLEAALKQYRGEEPRPGLEMRLLAGVRTRERAARRRRLAWAVAACVGVLAIIVLTLHVARTPLRRPTPSASLPQPVAKPPGPPMVSQQRPPALGAHRAPLQPPQQQVRRGATRRSRPDQFPTPLPLTEQEKLLLAYVSKAGTAGLAVGGSTTDEAPMTELTIPAINIAPLEIEPLDESQSELGK